MKFFSITCYWEKAWNGFVPRPLPVLDRKNPIKKFEITFSSPGEFQHGDKKKRCPTWENQVLLFPQYAHIL